MQKSLSGWVKLQNHKREEELIHMNRLLSISLLCLLLLLLFSSARPIISQICVNIVWSQLIPTLIEQRPGMADHAQWLQQATKLDPENRRAWRALGFAWSIEDKPTKMATAWQQAGHMDAELLHMGQQAERVYDYELALQRYDQATLVNPQLRDAWYYKGLIHERFQQWQTAADAYSQGIASDESITVQLGELYFWLARHVELKQAVRDPIQALELYEIALAMPFNDPWVQAQTHYRRGDVLRKLGRRRESMDEYRWVIEHRKKSYWAYVNLARLVWELDDDIKQAEALLEEAIAIDDKREAAYKLRIELK